MAPRLIKFKCWWCSRVYKAFQKHHEVRARDGKIRRCCQDCFVNPESNYRRVYASEEEEREQSDVVAMSVDELKRAYEESDDSW